MGRRRSRRRRERAMKGGGSRLGMRPLESGELADPLVGWGGFREQFF
jgi:hypothetical protein